MTVLLSSIKDGGGGAVLAAEGVSPLGCSTAPVPFSPCSWSYHEPDATRMVPREEDDKRLCLRLLTDLDDLTPAPHCSNRQHKIRCSGRSDPAQKGATEASSQRDTDTDFSHSWQASDKCAYSALRKTAALLLPARSIRINHRQVCMAGVSQPCVFFLI
ncbi:hypothetical protein EYF80_034646 [Liparis tanakae]|uniref:Uncharacterized protein n=1 Tax=Liparis tanakae TaxID=230148 RepID=A0A4Z2GQZ0_9TELE|nr:hypothetical protein EYF80_034646 [Liparis tanakae]